jgi:hypothetical protein
MCAVGGTGRNDSAEHLIRMVVFSKVGNFPTRRGDAQRCPPQREAVWQALACYATRRSRCERTFKCIAAGMRSDVALPHRMVACQGDHA